MKELIERLRKATGPERALDLAIAQAVWPGVEFQWPDMYKATSEHWAKRKLEHYTGSIDAALMLVPKHFSRELSWSDAPASSPDLKFTRCRLWDWRRGPLAFDRTNEWKSEGNRALPINICIAALLAIEATPPTGSAPKDSGGRE